MRYNKNTSSNYILKERRSNLLKAHVVFATITGNNEDIADIVTEGLEDLGVETTETEISQTDPLEFKQADICVICAYTYNEGHLPDEGQDFYAELQKIKLPKQIYGVAGSGDKYYKQYYNVAVDFFAKAFAKTGAKRGAANVKINLDPGADDIKTLDAFSKSLVATAKKQR